MHGCRECDWDACEQCTDMAEGGVIKLSKIKQMASECQHLLFANDESLLAETHDLIGIPLVSILDRPGCKDKASELNKLSLRLLQRDTDSLDQLSLMLESPGQITAHQFVTLVLPSLHSSLVGRSEICRRQRFGPRCKKARVVVFSSRDTNNFCPPFSG